MRTRLTLVLAALTVLILYGFWGRLQTERRDVWNRGVNQSPVVLVIEYLA